MAVQWGNMLIAEQALCKLFLTSEYHFLEFAIVDAQIRWAIGLTE